MTGKRKFTAFWLSLAMFGVISLVSLFTGCKPDYISLAAAVATVGSPFFVTNAAVHISGKTQNKES